jgi:gluconolactonase
MKRQPLVLALAVAAVCFAAPFAQAPDVPHGTVTKSTWKSTIFPGTERDYWVYVPAQYDGTKPAAVMVFQDGAAYIKPDGAWKVHEAFDRLIAAGEMPVTIGLFISPGVLPPPRQDALPRFNRSFEYDAVSDRYARFLLEEMLPEVGKQYKLTTDPNLRAIGGASSGAIAAFTVAWERPDAFRRVFSTIGTYVGLRGGNDYATYVRKTEPKPLRVFLQDGTNDLNIYGGNWWVANQDMLSALEFSGYQVNHVWGDGGHDSKQGSAILADALRWLWKDWTTPIRAGVGSKQPLMDVLEEGSVWQAVGAEYGFADGPASSPLGEVFFSDTKAGHIYKIGLDGAVTMFVKDAPGTAGLMFGPDGRLYAALHGPRQVVAYDAAGALKVIADDIDADDLAISASGHLYVSDWVKKQLWHIAPGGTKEVADKSLAHPNGLTLTPDQTQLYVADMRSQWIWAFQIAPDGTLAYAQPYCDLHIPYGAVDSGADGMTIDTMGRPYVATRLGVQYCDQAGRVNGILSRPQAGWTANVVFGGTDKRDLYVTVGGRVYKRHTKAVGVRSADAPMTPPPPRL